MPPRGRAVVGAMSIRKREGNRPDRRLCPEDDKDSLVRALLCARLRYVGSGHHKLRPANYGFLPPQNPRPSKSVCDDRRPILLEEAEALFRRGIELGMFSPFAADAVPKYVWSVDYQGEVYEAKTNPKRETDYHGYRLGDDERAMRSLIVKAWRERCAKP